MITRIIERSLKRNPPARANLPYLWWHYVANAQRARRARGHAAAYPDTPGFVRQLQEDGITLGPSQQYLSEDGQRALAEASEMVLGIAASDDVRAALASGETGAKKDYLVNLIPWEHRHKADSPLLRLGLDPKLLEIVAAHFGMYPHLLDIGAWLNFPTSDGAKDAQLWHRDPEDARLVKVFIYLVDVDEKRGPFTYIPKTHPFGALASKTPEHSSRARVLDAAMQKVLPAETWRVCTGPKHTMIMADTVGFHRGGKPLDASRILITFTFTSGTPFKHRRFAVAGQPSWHMNDLQRSAL